MTSLSKIIVTILALTGSAFPAIAGEADVVDVVVSKASDGSYRFDVTVLHADTGWDHYADAFDILTPDGTVLGTRKLLHPHENEQPFTRSLTSVTIPDGIAEVHVRAHDSVHGYGGKERAIALSAR